MMKADIEPLPEQIPIKGLLKRIVQIAKCHRDLMFDGYTRQHAPISIIITTLAAQSYADTVRRGQYARELDLIYDVISNMDRYIEVHEINDNRYYNIQNPTTQGENFAEKWNTHPERAEGFFAWQRQALQDLDKLANTEGLDAIFGHLKTRIIGPESTRVLNIVTNRLGIASESGVLRATPALGLGLTTGQTVKANTCFGK